MVLRFETLKLTLRKLKFDLHHETVPSTLHIKTTYRLLMSTLHMTLHHPSRGEAGKADFQQRLQDFSVKARAPFGEHPTPNLPAKIIPTVLRLLDSNFPGNPLWAWEFHPLQLILCLSQILRNPES